MIPLNAVSVEIREELHDVIVGWYEGPGSKDPWELVDMLLTSGYLIRRTDGKEEENQG